MERRSLAVLTALLVHVLFLGVAHWTSRYAGLRPSLQQPLLIEMAPPSAQNATPKKKLLIPQRPSLEAPRTPPPSDARYFSDQNRRFDREQRARDGGIQDLARLQSPSLTKSLTAKHVSPRSRDSSNQQRILDPLAPEGAENFLNTVQSVHYSFYSRMYFSLAPIWQSFVRGSQPMRPLSPGDYTVIADLILDEEGRLLGVEFREPSDVPQFNEAVVASAKKVQRFPNPPRELIDSNREVRTLWSFTVNVGENSFFNVLPPRRIQ